MNKKPSLAGWELLGDRASDDFTIFRTRRSLRRNLRNGHETDFFIIDGLNWANVIALTPRNEVVLIRQFRHGVDCEGLELPGGCVEAAEEPIAGATRELEEETGYTVKEMKFLGQVAPNPAMMSIQCYFYVGYEAALRGSIHLDPGENIEVVLCPLDEALKLAAHGEIQHALHVAALGMLAMRRGEFLGG